MKKDNIREEPQNVKGIIIKPINLEKLKPKTKTMVENSKKSWISINSRCLCGSDKRFKNCCMELKEG